MRDEVAFSTARSPYRTSSFARPAASRRRIGLVGLKVAEMTKCMMQLQFSKQASPGRLSRGEPHRQIAGAGAPLGRPGCPCPTLSVVRPIGDEPLWIAID